MSPHVELMPRTEDVHQDTLLGREQQRQQQGPKYPQINDWPSDLQPVQIRGTLCTHEKGIDRKGWRGSRYSPDDTRDGLGSHPR